MFKIIWYFMFFPFYMIIWGIKLYVLIFKCIIKFIVNLCEPKNNGRNARTENWDRVNEITYDLDSRRSKDIFDTTSNGKYEYGEEVKPKEIVEKSYELVRPGEKEYKETANSIEHMYKKIGYNVKVTNIEKHKYNTSYEAIFSTNETSQYEILCESDNIKNQFNVDGVNIKPNKKFDNKIIICVPLEYKEVKITLDNDEAGEIDPFLDEAIELALNIGYITITLIQRRFKIGYERAAKIISQMEERKVISPYKEDKARNVLISKETWQRLKNKI